MEAELAQGMQALIVGALAMADRCLTTGAPQSRPRSAARARRAFQQPPGARPCLLAALRELRAYGSATASLGVRCHERLTAASLKSVYRTVRFACDDGTTIESDSRLSH